MQKRKKIKSKKRNTSDRNKEIRLDSKKETQTIKEHIFSQF